MRGDSSFDSGYYIAERFCEMSSRPEAVFCDSDYIALGALRCFSDKLIYSFGSGSNMLPSVSSAGRSFVTPHVKNIILMTSKISSRVAPFSSANFA